MQFINELGLTLLYTLDTHVHADHVTGASVLKERLGSKIIYPVHSGVTDADRLVGEGDVVEFGSFALKVRETPGHTDTCVTYITQDQTMAFTGDALMVRGCGRTDFQQGDAARLYASVHGKILSLPEQTKLYPGHDYKGRTVTTPAEELAYNPRLGGGNTVEQFTEIMNNLNLAYPGRIDVALPANLALGRQESTTR